MKNQITKLWLSQEEAQAAAQRPWRKIKGQESDKALFMPYDAKLGIVSPKWVQRVERDVDKPGQRFFERHSSRMPQRPSTVPGAAPVEIKAEAAPAPAVPA